MKVCKECEVELSEMNTYASLRSLICRKCFNLKQAERFRQNRAKLIAAKGGKCSKCGYNRYQGALDFHHTDPSKKDRSFRYLRMWSFERAMKELETCIILCRNCHAELHGEGY